MAELIPWIKGDSRRALEARPTERDTFFRNDRINHLSGPVSSLVFFSLSLSLFLLVSTSSKTIEHKPAGDTLIYYSVWLWSRSRCGGNFGIAPL